MRKAIFVSAIVAMCVAQPPPAKPDAAPPKPATPPRPPSVYSNPRAGASDPRIGLKAGLTDAAEVAWGMVRVATIPKPPGFAHGNNAVSAPEPPSDDPNNTEPRRPSLQFGSTNSDLAFSGNHVFVGNYNGINFYDIDNPADIKLRTSLLCPGGQGDVSVHKNLLFMSAEAMNGRLDCGAQGIPLPAGYKPPPLPKPDPNAAPGTRPRRPPPPANPDRFRGLRIFDISDISRPKQVAAVQSCRGSHTHTLVVDPKDKDNVYIYISGTGPVRQKEELADCSGDDPDKNPETALFRIDIVKVPLAHPERAKIVNSPRIFADEKTGAAAGLWKGGTHGEGTQPTSRTDKCHDITVYSAIGLAAGACSGNGIVLDISNPANPKRIEAVTDPNYAFWHSATFSNDGSKVLFTDEWGGGSQPRCRATDPMHWGADAIFTLDKGKLTLASYYKMPAPQTDKENCVAHNGSLIPIPGRDVMVQGWYQGGVSIVDFTDASRPFEIAYFDRGPTDANQRGSGGHWSTYWYNGYIYGAEIARGLDVFKLEPNEHMTQNEIDAASQVRNDVLNVQNQTKIEWPSNFITGRAYVDQLERGKALSAERIDALRKSMADGARTNPRALQTLAASLDRDAATAKSSADAKRMQALAGIFRTVGRR
ncbi:MAG: hypothetical protein FJW32_10920 [Acidobacteria bacterium]|nr:hypothetical protein [Acidobacteriota bacterium]